MTIRHGLFRIWWVASLLWTVGATYMLWASWHWQAPAMHGAFEDIPDLMIDSSIPLGSRFLLFDCFPQIGLGIALAMLGVSLAFLRWLVRGFFPRANQG
jgi:hypothetical protein